MAIHWRRPINPPPLIAAAVDLEWEAPRATGSSTRVLAVSLLPYQRLIANPFLAVLAVVSSAEAIRYSFRIQKVEILFTAICGSFLIPFLLQYHCLDCGSTGLVWRSSGHSCAFVQARIQAGRARRMRGPSATAQMKLWLLGLGAVGLLAWIIY